MRKTTMEDIAEAAHMRAASIYYYFKNKEEVFSSALRTIGGQYLSRVRTAVEAAHSGKEQMQVYMKKRLAAESEMGSNFDTTSEVVIELMPLVREATTELMASDTELIVQILHHGIDDGSFEIDDVEQTAVVLQAALMGVGLSCRTGDFDEEVVFPKLCELLLQGLLKHASTEVEEREEGSG